MKKQVVELYVRNKLTALTDKEHASYEKGPCFVVHRRESAQLGMAFPDHEFETFRDRAETGLFFL
jgi:hypothetical protein